MSIDKIPYDFYDKVEKSEYVKRVLYGDSIPGWSTVFVKYPFYDLERESYIYGKVYVEDLFVRVDYRDDVTGKEYCYYREGDLYAASIDLQTGEVSFKPVEFIMRHKLDLKNKKLFQIIGSPYGIVYVTSDHSIIVKRDDNLTVTTPLSIQPNDKLISYDFYRNEIDFINIKEIIDVTDKLNENSYVYDLHVRDNNTFLADNFFVHNTDSLFIQVFNKDEFNKLGYELKPEKEVIDEIEEKFVLPVSKKINKNLIEYWNNNLLKKLNVDPEWNTIDFKTEIVMDKILLLGVKKRYVCRIFKEEKTYYIPPKLKFTGIEIKRSDSSRLTKYALQKIIDIIFTYEDRKERIQETKKLVLDIKKKFDNAKKEYDFELVGIPSSWGIKEYKSIPTYVYGALLYNTLVQDICRPGVKGYRIHIKLNIPKIKEIISNLKNKSDFQFDLKTFESISNKLDIIFIPPEFNKEKIKQLEKDKIIQIDWDTQYNKIIKEKLETYIDIVKS
jgi:hypothetical protein